MQLGQELQLQARALQILHLGWMWFLVQVLARFNVGALAESADVHIDVCQKCL